MRDTLSKIAKIHEKGSKFIESELKNNGIKGLVTSHGDILAVLYAYGEMTMKDIADKIHRTRPTVTVLVNKLEKNGYVTRKVSPQDNRFTFIELTPQGEKFKPIFEKISTDLNNLLGKNLTKEEIDILDKLLEKILMTD